MATEYKQVDIKDALKSALTAVAATVFLIVYQLVMGDGFNLFQVDWSTFSQQIINLSVAAFFGDIGRRFFTDSNGKLFGKI